MGGRLDAVRLIQLGLKGRTLTHLGLAHSYAAALRTASRADERERESEEGGVGRDVRMVLSL